MAADKRTERMLEEILKVPGNDCKAAAPRWASVNLGIFICVQCATVHRKMGTHKSRVKSVTLDTWSREHLTAVRSIGNTASNQIWNPDERRNPPPTSLAGDDRDGELEKFIRRKYEQGAFKAGANGTLPAPTSLNRARAARDDIGSGSRGRDAAQGGGSGSGMIRQGSWTTNQRNPELNDIISTGSSGMTASTSKEKDLPRLPKTSTGGSSAGTGTASGSNGSSLPPRQRPIPTSRGNTPQPTGGSSGTASLIDLGEGTSATLPLQMQMQTGYTRSNGLNGDGVNGFGASPNGMARMSWANGANGIQGQMQMGYQQQHQPQAIPTGQSLSPFPSSQLYQQQQQRQQQSFNQAQSFGASGSSYNSQSFLSTSPSPNGMFHQQQQQLSPSSFQHQSYFPSHQHQQQQQSSYLPIPATQQPQFHPNGMQSYGTSPSGYTGMSMSPGQMQMGMGGMATSPGAGYGNGMMVSQMQMQGNGSAWQSGMEVVGGMGQNGMYSQGMR